ncbi:hypothetical protein [Methanoculleus chikugoensis]|uniref:SDH family Clp fold serine proteinase n=1 Tax=Methanoculleus chikugoensis TaxID=118126 RepID=UPI0006D19AEC|nr:hypothetical protein [Methanoculleus chikugoensis]
MTYAERVDLYKQIEEERERPLITYVTSSRPNAEGIIASDVIPEICRQILKIPPDKKEIDLLVVSRGGGDPIVSWRIVSLLRERFESVNVLIPYEAYSAATLLALGADEIVMHPFSNLGPVDPQLHGTKKVPGLPGQQEEVRFGAEDLSHFLDFVRKDVGISDQEQLERAFELVCQEVGSIPIGIAKRSSNLALSLGEKLLRLHMGDHTKVKAISEALNKSFYHHGYPVGRKEAKEIGLEILDAPEELEKLMWAVWEDIEAEMKCREPFQPHTVVMQEPSFSQQPEPTQQIQVPPVGPPHPSGQSFSPMIQGGVQPLGVAQIEYDLFQATVESTRMRSEFKTKLKISAVRMSDLNININVTPISQGWKTLD